MKRKFQVSFIIDIETSDIWNDPECMWPQIINCMTVGEYIKDAVLSWGGDCAPFNAFRDLKETDMINLQVIYAN